MFTAQFWQSLQEALGTQLCFSTAFHPQTDGQSERMIQILEDMLRSCVLTLGGNWESHLPLIEFVYNNSYQASIGMAPYEALYGRPCRSPLCWAEAGEPVTVGPELVRQASEKIQIIRQRLLTAQSRQKSYADKRRRPLEFTTDDSVFIKVAPMKGVMRFGKKGKLSPRYVGPYRILERIEKVAYRLELPAEMASVHDVFHVSMLKKYVPDASHVLTMQSVQIYESLSYEEKPVEILDRKTKTLRNKEISLVKAP
ncbi:hypothetical protein NP234_24490 [Salmonella enterica]|nr:hypothetical protein [Salmonella enterica]